MCTIGTLDTACVLSLSLYLSYPHELSLSPECPGGEEEPSVPNVVRQCTWQRRCWRRVTSGTSSALSALSVARCWTGTRFIVPTVLPRLLLPLLFPVSPLQQYSCMGKNIILPSSPSFFPSFLLLPCLPLSSPPLFSSPLLPFPPLLPSLTAPPWQLMGETSIASPATRGAMVSRVMVTVRVLVCWPPRQRGLTAPVEVCTVLVVW